MALTAEIYLAVLLAGLGSFVAIQLLRPLANKVGLVDLPGDRKSHVGQVPLVGGVAVYASLVLSLVVFSELDTKLFFLFSTGIIILFTGMVDDYRELGAKLRICIQIAVTFIMIEGSGVYLHSLGDLLGFGDIVLDTIWGKCFTVFAVVGVVNAFNMMDGVDGLAGCLALVVVLGVVISEYLSGQYFYSGLLAIFSAAMIPYLMINLSVLSKQKVFLGDAGSCFIGYLLAWVLIDISQGENSVINPANALWLVAVPLLDITAVMIRRIGRKQSPFQADRSHLHHLLQDKEVSSSKILGIILMFALIAILPGILIPVSSIAFGLFSVFMIAYTVSVFRLSDTS